MEVTVVGKELFYDGDYLHKSRVSLPVLEVVFGERIDDGAFLGWDVFAVTSRGRYQIGAIYEKTNWVGSRDLVVTDKGFERLFVSTSPGASASKDKEDFISQWKGSHIFVRPELPSNHKEGDRAFIGGDAILIEAWVHQSRVWMKLAVETSEKDNDQYLNVAYIMAGYAMELVFKSLAWTEGIDIRPVHKIGSFYCKLSEEKRRTITSIVEDNGWKSANDIIDYVDDYLNPVHRRYFGINTDRKYAGLNILKDNRLISLAKVHYSLCQVVQQLLIRPA